ncbi:MAG: amino acid permease [Phaeodactylibacter sp.]|nr:amino acid permease [Phaeodactylibacter sp.]
MPHLDRKLTLFGLTMIAVGSCIGSGIFVTPYEIVQAVPHHAFVLLVWAIGGIIALTGALTFAELGGMFPQAGGVYVFLKEAYGELAGFLYGWVILLVINTGALAALGIALAEYLSYFYPLDYWGKIVIAIVVIAGLTGINLVGVNTSQWFANIFTGLKLLAIFGVIIAGLVFFDPAKVQLNFNPIIGTPANLGSSLLLALIGVLWSFGGWHHASYLAGEAIEPQRTVPRAMVFGALIVTATYVLANLAYMLLLPLDAIANTTRVAGEAVGQVIFFGGKLMAIAIAVSIFGTIGIYTMSAPRIYFAMAKDGIFFQGLSYVHPRFHTPSNAMLLQAGWAILLLLFWGTFSELITYVTFMDIAFMALAGLSVFVFRKKLPEAERPYRTWGYPVIPGIFVLISSAFVVNTLIQRPVQAIAGLIFLLLGIGAYYLFRSLQER